MATTQYLKGDTEPVIAPVLTAQAVAQGDITGLSSGNVVRAEDETWLGTTALTQQSFARKYLGVSCQRKTAGTARVDGNSEDNVIRVDPEGVFESDCASATFAVGDLIGPAKQTGNALESQKVVAVADESLAIGRVFEKGTSVTRVKWKSLSTTMPAARQQSLTTGGSGAGTPAGTGVTAGEVTDSVVHQTTLTITSLTIDVTDSNAYGSQKIYDFPEGRVLVLGVTSSLQWGVTTTRASTINDSASLTWSVGTAAASNATLSSTMVDLVPKTTKVLSASGSTLNSASTAALASSAQFDGTGTAKDAYLNVGFETGTDIDGDGTLIVTGTVTLTWVNLGDY